MQLSMFLSAAKQRRCLINSLLIIPQPTMGVNCFQQLFISFLSFLRESQPDKTLPYSKPDGSDMIFCFPQRVFSPSSRYLRPFGSIKNALLSEKYSYYTTGQRKMSNKLQARENIFFRKTLTDVGAGQSCTVTEVSSLQAAQRLAELGLTENVAITVLRVAPFGDPMEISLRGYRLCLRKETADKIFVTDKDYDTPHAIGKKPL